MTTATFAKRPYSLSEQIINTRLTGDCFRVLEMLFASTTFTDGFVHIPPAKKIAEILKIGVSSVYQHLKKIREKFTQFNFVTVRSATLISRSELTENCQLEIFLPSVNLENIPVKQNYFQKFIEKSENLEIREPEPLQEKGSGSLQTLQTDQTPQTPNLEVEKKINSESELPKKVSETMPIFNSVNKSVKKNIPYAVTQVKYEIPQELLKRLEELNIKPERRVRKAIAAHHISQAFGAATYVENSYSSITHPTEMFLKHLPRQPVEKLGDRYGEEKLAEIISENESIKAQRESPDYWKDSKDSLSHIRQVLSKKVQSLK